VSANQPVLLRPPSGVVVADYGNSKQGKQSADATISTPRNHGDIYWPHRETNPARRNSAKTRRSSVLRAEIEKRSRRTRKEDHMTWPNSGIALALLLLLAAGIGSATEGKASLIRDPFKPFSLQPPGEHLPRSPLERYDLRALTLVAVIWDSPAPKAMVEDAAGIGYTIGVGTRIGTALGVVKAIEPDRVIVEEQFSDFYGETKKRESVLELRPEERKAP
jgi:hypothetical protein